MSILKTDYSSQLAHCLQMTEPEEHVQMTTIIEEHCEMTELELKNT